MPILLMQIHDSAGLLENALCDYMALGKITEKDQNKFGRHYLDKLEQTENAIRASFDALKKERTYYKEDGVEKLSGRLATSLTDLFEKLYPAAVPFDFDGFDSKQNSKARKAFCSIVKLVLSEQVNENTVHAFSVDVRNRFDATLFVNGASSWKIISADYHVMPPANKQALTFYEVAPLPEPIISESTWLPPYAYDAFRDFDLVAVCRVTDSREICIEYNAYIPKK